VASDDGSKITISRPGEPQVGFFELFNVDNSTGKVTKSLKPVSDLGQISGIAFSANGNYLYISRLKQSLDLKNTYAIHQYNTAPSINVSNITLVRKMRLTPVALFMNQDVSVN